MVSRCNGTPLWVALDDLVCTPSDAWCSECLFPRYIIYGIDQYSTSSVDKVWRITRRWLLWANRFIHVWVCAVSDKLCHDTDMHCYANRHSWLSCKKDKIVTLGATARPKNQWPSIFGRLLKLDLFCVRFLKMWVHVRDNNLVWMYKSKINHIYQQQNRECTVVD